MKKNVKIILAVTGIAAALGIGYSFYKKNKKNLSDKTKSAKGETTDAPKKVGDTRGGK